MAEDLARLPATGIQPVIRDAPPGQFRLLHASPERDLVIDILMISTKLTRRVGMGPAPAAASGVGCWLEEESDLSRNARRRHLAVGKPTGSMSDG